MSTYLDRFSQKEEINQDHFISTVVMDSYGVPAKCYILNTELFNLPLLQAMLKEGLYNFSLCSVCVRVCVCVSTHILLWFFPFSLVLVYQHWSSFPSGETDDVSVNSNWVSHSLPLEFSAETLKVVYYSFADESGRAQKDPL